MSQRSKGQCYNEEKEPGPVWEILTWNITVHMRIVEVIISTTCDERTGGCRKVLNITVICEFKELKRTGSFTVGLTFPDSFNLKENGTNINNREQSKYYSSCFILFFYFQTWDDKMFNYKWTCFTATKKNKINPKLDLSFRITYWQHANKHDGFMSSQKKQLQFKKTALLAARLRRLHEGHFVAMFPLVAAGTGLVWSLVFWDRVAAFLLEVCGFFFTGGLFCVSVFSVTAHWRGGRWFWL